MGPSFRDILLFVSMALIGLMLEVIPEMRAISLFWLLFVILYWARYRPFNGLIELSLILGVLRDFMLLQPYGVSSLGLVICCFSVLKLNNLLRYWSLTRWLGTVMGCILGYHFIQLSLLNLFGEQSLQQQLWWPFASNFLLWLLCHWLLKWCVKPYPRRLMRPQ